MQSFTQSTRYLCWPGVTLAASLFVSVLFAAPLRSDETAATGAAGVGAAAVAPDTASAAPMPSPPPATPAATLPSVAELTAMRQAATQDAELDDATRMQLDQHFAKAIENLQLAEQADRKLAALSQELESAPQETAKLQERLSGSSAAVPAPAAADLNAVDILSTRLKELEAQADGARQQSQEFKAEVDRRAARRPQLGGLRADTDQQLQETGQALAAAAPEGEHPRVTAARLIRMQTKQYRLRRELALLEQEVRTYEGTSKLWSLKQDLANRDLRDTERAVQQWRQLLAEAQRRQAQAEEREARRVLAQSHPSVRNEAEHNSVLADQNSHLVNSLREAQLKLDGLSAELLDRTQEFESLSKRAEAAEFSPAIGVLLRNRQSELPDLDDLRREIARRQSEIADLNLHLMEWEAERKPLVDLTEATDEVIAGLDSIPESITEADLVEQVQSLLAARFKLLNDLTESGRRQLDLLVRIDSQQKQLVAAVDREDQWLAKHVLWVRSTHVVGTQPRQILDSVADLLDQRAWTDIARTVLLELSDHRTWWIAGVVGLVALLVLRRRAKRAIKGLGEIAGRSNCVDILPTVKAALLTLFASACGPLFVLFLGWRVDSIAGDADLLKALGCGLEALAVSWFAVALVRQIAQHHGLADAHFGWPRPALAALRRTTRFLGVGMLPFVMLVAFTEELGNSEVVATIGRLAYLAGMLAFAWAMFRLLRPSAPMLQSLKSTDPDGVLYRARFVWTNLFVAVPLLLAVLSAAGFHYTAVQFARRAAISVVSALLILVVTAFLHRWLLLTYRKLAIRRSRERREQLQHAARSDSEQVPPPEVTPELTLVDINAQSRRMLRLASGVCSVIALYLIWVDVLPALGFLRNIELWQLAEATDEAVPQWITAADVLNAILIAGLTILASRNLPGMMEIAVLQRLPLDAGARYAATTVSRYVIVVTGFVSGFRTIGVGWSSVQWLVAAMTVGLGFGLQEIFANFVSGIILLFERPIRVGDLVTIGGSSGTVTRIQIRATTILDWDYKELIVPNREFVTGNLVNWTLSSPILRMVIKVGIAYGSDTRRATELLLQAAAENSLILTDPAPMAVFTQFGPSSLDYELRVYVGAPRNYGRAQHELHLAVDDLFRRHNIEIAFPHQDVRVRALPEEVLTQLSHFTRSRGEPNPADQRNAA